MQWAKKQTGFTIVELLIVIVVIAVLAAIVTVAYNAATTVAGMQYWIDDVMLVKGTEPANYADGNSAGWVWSGTANNSTSSGPAL